MPVTIEITNDLYQASGNAVKTDTNCYRLTTATGNQQGQVWSAYTIDLNSSFEITFDANFGNNDAGADGIAFGFQRANPYPAFASGAIGLGLGFQGITPSFGVEFDTYQNGSEPTFDHTNFFWNGNVTNSSAATATSTAPVQMSSTTVNVEDGIPHTVKIIWNRETNTMSVYFDGAFRTEYKGDIVASIFSNNANVYFGYTASTGASVNQHSVCEIKFNAYPVINSNGGGATASISVPENSTAVTTVTSTDQENNARTYSIIGGADAAKFNITSTGVLTFKSAPNFEAPGSAGGTNTYLVTVRVTETGSATSYDEQAITVNVTNVNEAPSTPTDINAAANTVAENAATGTLVGITARSTDPDGGTISYALTNDAGGRFSINSTSGVVTVANGALLDFESATSHSITVRASDGVVFSATQNFTINVTNVNEAPVITSNGGSATAATTIAENTTAVTTVTATDVDATTTLTYTISGGADVGKFSINPSTGLLTFITAPDYENPTDSDRNNSYLVTVRVTDNGSPTLFKEQAITVNVTNVNEAPVAINVAHSTPIINTAAFENLDGILTATDPDGEHPLTFRLSNLPSTAIGVLRVNGVNANTTTDYPWADRYKLTFDPVNTAIADVVFNYTVKDAGGLTSNSATYTIPLNDYPRSLSKTNTNTLSNGAAATSIDALTASDSDGTIQEFRISVLPTPEQGLLYINGEAATTSKYYNWLAYSNKLTFDPASPNTADATFRFTVVDSENGETPDVHAGTITIPINGEPIAVAVTNYPTIPSTADATLLKQLEGNDGENPAGAPSFFKVMTKTGQGALMVDGQAVALNTPYAWSMRDRLAYDPLDAETADASFAFTVSDSEGAWDATPATYIISLKNNARPETKDFTTQTLLNTANVSSLTIPVTAFPTDADGSIAYVKFLEVPVDAQGVLRVNGRIVEAGQIYTFTSLPSITFDPAEENLADVYIKYTVIDNDGAEDLTPATITIPINGEPIAEDVMHSPAIVSTADATLLNPLRGNDGEVPAGIPDFFRIATMPASGTLTVDNQTVAEGQAYSWDLHNTLKYDPLDATATGNITFTYSVADSDKAWDATPATYTIPVTNNRRPIARNITFTKMLNTDGPKVLTITNGIYPDDEDLNTLKFKFLSVPTANQGTLSVGE
ncbi:hypothetical protein GCM10028895_48170 [Pontibacter rugosus]